MEDHFVLVAATGMKCANKEEKMMQQMHAVVRIQTHNLWPRGLQELSNLDVILK